MSGPATPVSLRNVPCEVCGSRRAVRWMYNGHVRCLRHGVNDPQAGEYPLFPTAEVKK